jgi:hypothetical protein
MNFISKKTGGFWGVLSVVALLALPGCGYDGADLCDDGCECTGCSDNEYDDCIDTAGDLEREVESEGCDNQYADYLDCIGSEFRCVDSKVDADGCSKQSTSLFNCLN